MTTNKPKVVAWKWRKSVVNDHGETVGGTCKLGEAPGVPLVRLSDYKALQAECEQLRKDAERYRWLRKECQKHTGLTIAKCDEWSMEGWSGDDPDAAIDAAMETQK